MFVRLFVHLVHFFFIKANDFIIKQIIYFKSSTLLKEKPRSKVILKHDITNYFQQFTKTLSICFQWNTTHRDLVMCNYIWLEELNVCAKHFLFQINIFVYWIKFVKCTKLFKVQGTVCYDINDTFISFIKNGLLEFVEFEFRYVSSFSCIWRKDGKVFGKSTMTFSHNIAYMVNSFLFHYISVWQLWLTTYKNYSKFYTRKQKKQHCNYNYVSIVYNNSNVARLRIRNHQIIFYNNLLGNRARLAHHPAPILWF